MIAPGGAGVGPNIQVEARAGSILCTDFHLQNTASLSSLSSMAAYGPEVRRIICSYFYLLLFLPQVTKKFKPFYPRVVGGLMVLEKDPDPQVAQAQSPALTILPPDLQQCQDSAGLPLVQNVQCREGEVGGGAQYDSKPPPLD